MGYDKSVKSTTKNSPSIHVGKNPDNKSADFYAGFVYPEGGSNKDIGVYKQPMENPNNAIAQDIANKRDFTNKKTAYDVSVVDPAMTVSIGYNDTENARGVGKMRGFGAAIKGHKISGKQG
jgi:hypothetical protein